jgi:hypothetical protein
MASKVEDVFLDAWKNTQEEIFKKEEKAFKNAMDRITKGLNEVMRKATVENFYDGYTPEIYVRTGELAKAISLTTDDISVGDSFMFSIHPVYDETKMNHQTYKVHGKYKHKKHGKFTGNV